MLAGPPRPVELRAHPGSDALHQKPHRLARDRDVALGAQDAVVARDRLHPGHDRLGGGIGRQRDDDGLEVVVIVGVLIVVMARPRVEIGFRRRAEAEHDARIDAAFNRFQHRNAARRFRQHRLARLGETLRADQIGLVEDHDVGAGDLVLENFAERGIVIHAGVVETLPRDCRQIGREPAVRDGLRVGHGDHAVNRDAGSQVRPIERLKQGFRQRQA